MTDPIWTTALPSGTILVGAHRGASTVASENTAAAFEAAIAAKADFIETDLRLSRDGVPVVFHDADLKRLCGDPRAIAELDMDELQTLHPSIITVADTIDLVGERASILLDTKLYEPAALQRCIDILGSRTSTGRVAFGVRSLEVFDVIHRHLPECPTLGLFSDIGDYATLAARGGRWARLWEPDASPGNIARLHKLGLKVVVMTGYPTDGSVGLIAAEGLVALFGGKPDAVMINDPALAVALRKHASQPV